MEGQRCCLTSMYGLTSCPTYCLSKGIYVPVRQVLDTGIAIIDDYWPSHMKNNSSTGRGKAAVSSARYRLRSMLLAIVIAE